MKFAITSIWIISLFWLIPVMALFYLYAFKKKKRLIHMFCKAHLREWIMPRHSPGRQWFKAILILISIFHMILALMRPRWGFHWEEIRRVGVDIMVAADCSQSMMATDVNPNRLERAKREIQDLLNMLDVDRIGLVAFAGTSFMQCPLTLDYGAFRIFLDYIDTDLIPVQGTAIGHALQECIRSFDRAQKGSKAIILITDGEDHEGDPLAAASEAKQKGIKIFPIGIGKEGGAPIPVKEGAGFKKDRHGNLILTKLDEKTLQKMALETGGNYVRSVTGDMDLEKIYLEGIKMMDQKELASTKKRIWEERFQWFLFLTLILLVLEQILPEHRRIRKKKINTILSLSFLGLLFFMISGLGGTAIAGIIPSSKAKNAERLYAAKNYEQALAELLDLQIDSPEDPVLHYNIANTYYQMHNYEEASKNYQSAAGNSKDIKLEEKSYYNLGNCSYRMGKLDEAITWYQKALELDPDDEDAKYNLEFVREEIKRRINQAKEQQEKQGQGEEENRKQPEEHQTAQGDKEKAETHQQPEEKGEQGEQGEQGEKKPTEQPEADPNRFGQITAMEDANTPQPEEATEKDQAQAQQGQKAKQISPDEAKRLLESLDEDREKASQKWTSPDLGQYTPEKDW